MKLQDPECMAAIKVYGYLNKPSTKSRRFVILPPGIVHGTRSKLVSNWEHVLHQKLVNFMQKKDIWLQSAIIGKFILQTRK